MATLQRTQHTSLWSTAEDARKEYSTSIREDHSIHELLPISQSFSGCSSLKLGPDVAFPLTVRRIVVGSIRPKAAFLLPKADTCVRTVAAILFILRSEFHKDLQRLEVLVQHLSSIQKIFLQGFVNPSHMPPLHAIGHDRFGPDLERLHYTGAASTTASRHQAAVGIHAKITYVVAYRPVKDSWFQIRSESLAPAVPEVASHK